MGGDLFVLGLSWRTAPVEMRERLAFRDDELPDALRELVGSGAVGEAMLLSTCNRVEVYGATATAAPASAVTEAAAEARRFLASARGVPGEALAEHLYEHTAVAAIRHAFRVAASLDSMVVGETQILGQLKNAYGIAGKAGTAGPVLRRCMERGFALAKRVRSETGIGDGAANVSSVAVDLARHVFGDLFGKTVLVVGAGKMSDLAARHLRANGAGGLLVTNRSPEKAREVAARVDGTPRPWEALPEALAIADVVISSTGAREPVLTRKLIKQAMKKRRFRPIVIVDIAVPRDVEESAGGIDGVYLFDVDDLERVVAENLKQRQREAEAAVKLVDEEVLHYERWLRSQAVVPTIRALREHFLGVAHAEAERTIAALANKQSPEQRDQAIRRLAELIANKLLHAPMVALKSGEDEVDSEALASAAQRLFDLKGEQPAEPAAPAEPLPAKKKEPA